MRQQCTLKLQSGEVFEGRLIGAPVTASGELVFTTGMVGYSEAITDPSYFGQILVFSYPLIGNYGIPELARDALKDGGILPRGFESPSGAVSAVVLAVDTPECFHWNSIRSLDHWLAEEGIPGVVGLDTRHLVHWIRQHPKVLARVEPERPLGLRYSNRSAVTALLSSRDFLDPADLDVLDEVSTPERRVVGRGRWRVGVVDCGVKWNMVRQLVELGCEVELLPWRTDLRAVDCSGWLLSNGPGDPSRAQVLTDQVKGLLAERRPILGICLGHQILARAAGAATVRMPFGHRSHNQPVVLEGTRRGFITSQNHGYVVDEGTLPDGWEVWFRNANDGTLEGIRRRDHWHGSVQFHPEAAGGPRDTSWIMAEFVDRVRRAGCP